jgi:hypothetical protein
MEDIKPQMIVEQTRVIRRGFSPMESSTKVMLMMQKMRTTQTQPMLKQTDAKANSYAEQAAIVK